MSFEQSFQNLLGWEGGYGNNAKDPGGPTNLGVIQSEYDTYRKSKGLAAQSVKHITLAEAGDIYRNEYWDATLCGQLNEGVANATFDADVNSGDRRGILWLQEAVNQLGGHIASDGKMGPATVSAANACDPGKLIDAMLVLRLAFMKVARNPKTGALLWSTFGKGWSARINGVRVQSHALAGLTVPQTLLVQPQEEPSMANPAPVTVASSTSGLNVSTGTVINALLGNLTSALITIGAPLFAAAQGSTTAHYAAGFLFGLAGLGSLVTNTINFINHNSTASSNTVTTINNLSALAAQVGSALEPSSAPTSIAHTG